MGVYLTSRHRMIQRLLDTDLLLTVIVELPGSTLEVDMPTNLVVTIALDVATLRSPAELSSLLGRQCMSLV